MKPIRTTYDVMFTRLDVLLFEERERAETLFHEIHKMVFKLEKLFNKFDPESELSAINKSSSRKWIKLSTDMLEILKRGLQLKDKTNGYFDITYNTHNQNDWQLDEKKGFYQGVKNTSIDLGGLAKGYAIDRIKELFECNLIKTAFVSFGESSILGWGKHPFGEYWPVGTKDFFSPEKTIWTSHLKNNCLTGSSSFQKRNGKLYSHIKNPFTENIVTEHRVSSVISDSAIEGEALSTALVVAETDTERIKIMRNFPKCNSLVCEYKGKQIIKKTIYNGKTETFSA